MSKVVYLAHYSTPEVKRSVSPAGTAVMRYIIKSISRAGYKLIILSPAQSAEGTAQARTEQRIDTNTSCVFLPTTKCCDRWNLFGRLVGRIRRERSLLKELDRLVEEGDTLVVYHSLSLMRAVRKVRRKKKFRLIIQVAEIYSDIEGSILPGKREQELRYIRSADSYLFMSEQLARSFSMGKPYGVCSGTYQEEQNRGCNLFVNDLLPAEKRRIHCVYAGTFDLRKGGAIAAASAAEFLPENYHVHILGFGNALQIRKIQALINDLATRCVCGISYDGQLEGEDYIRFLQSCDIGLSTQNPEATFNTTSFPSKILSYIANGLRVVSARIPAIEESAVSEYLYFYDEQTPEAIAQAILQINLEDGYDGRKLIRQLDIQFTEVLNALL